MEVWYLTVALHEPETSLKFICRGIDTHFNAVNVYIEKGERAKTNKGKYISSQDTN